MSAAPKPNTPKRIKVQLLTISIAIVKWWQSTLDTIQLLRYGWRPIKDGKWEHRYNLPYEKAVYTTIAHNKEWALRHMQTQDQWLPKKK